MRTALNQPNLKTNESPLEIAIRSNQITNFKLLLDIIMKKGDTKLISDNSEKLFLVAIGLSNDAALSTLLSNKYTIVSENVINAFFDKSKIYEEQYEKAKTTKLEDKDFLKKENIKKERQKLLDIIRKNNELKNQFKQKIKAEEKLMLLFNQLNK